LRRGTGGIDPECKWIQAALAQKLGVIQQTINSWISDIRARQRANRNIIRLNPVGWPQGQIGKVVGVNQQRVSQITNNTNFGNIDNLLAQGRDMDYIARHYHMDLALTWASRLGGKADQEKFKELGWGLRTWDQWNFNKGNSSPQSRGGRGGLSFFCFSLRGRKAKRPSQGGLFFQFVHNSHYALSHKGHIEIQE